MRLPPWAGLLARTMVALLFLVSGGVKLTQTVPMQAYMRSFGVPGALIWPAAAFEVVGGLLLIGGLWLRPLLVLMAGWCLLTAIIFHTAFSDPTMLMMFLKNVTMAGAFLLLATTATPGAVVPEILRAGHALPPAVSAAGGGTGTAPSSPPSA